MSAASFPESDSLLGGVDIHRVKEAAHEHLLLRIEELGAEFGRWTREAIYEFVAIEVANFARLRRTPIDELEQERIVVAVT